MVRDLIVLKKFGFQTQISLGIFIIDLFTYQLKGWVRNGRLLVPEKLQCGSV